MESAIQHFKTQFGLDFSNIQPNDANQRLLGNATLSPVMAPVNSTLVVNNWILSGGRNSKCFPVGSGAFEVGSTVMLHGVYDCEERLPVSVSDFLGVRLLHACTQQPTNIRLTLQHAYCQLRDGGLRSLSSTITSLVGGVLRMSSRQGSAQMTKQW